MAAARTSDQIPPPLVSIQQDLAGGSPPKSASDVASGGSGYQRGVTEFHGSSHPTANLLAPLAPLLMPFRCECGRGRLTCNLEMPWNRGLASPADPAAGAIQVCVWVWMCKACFSVSLTALFTHLYCPLPSSLLY